MTQRCLLALALAAVLVCGAAGADAPAAAPAAVPAAAAPAAPIAAAPAARPVPAQPFQPAAASAGSLVQTISGLTVVLLVLAGFAWAMKRFGPRPQAGAGALRIVSALNLGGRERIIVVEVGDQWIVVGASPGRVNALATMPRQQGAPAALAEHAPPATSFAQWLKQTIDKRNAE